MGGVLVFFEDWRMEFVSVKKVEIGKILSVRTIDVMIIMIKIIKSI